MEGPDASTHPTNKRKRPLQERDDNVSMPQSKREAQKPQKPQKQLHQMQIYLGGDLQKACNECGMQYVPSNAEDRAMHKKFHAIALGGVTIAQNQVQLTMMKRVWVADANSYIFSVAKGDALALRNLARRLLDVVNGELYALDIGKDELWGDTDIPPLRSPAEQNTKAKGENPTSAESSSQVSPRYKAFIYVRERRCVGFCLAERIKEAHRVLPREDEKDAASVADKPLMVTKDTFPVVMGISRIWTLKTCRQQGIAEQMLNCAAKHFLRGFMLGKQLIAFTQPTESGTRLARRWYDRPDGWLVYAG